MNRKLKPDDTVMFSELLRRRAVVRKITALGILIRIQDVQFPLEIDHEIWVTRRELRINKEKEMMT